MLDNRRFWFIFIDFCFPVCFQQIIEVDRKVWQIQQTRNPVSGFGKPAALPRSKAPFSRLCLIRPSKQMSFTVGWHFDYILILWYIWLVSMYEFPHLWRCDIDIYIESVPNGSWKKFLRVCIFPFVRVLQHLPWLGHCANKGSGQEAIHVSSPAACPTRLVSLGKNLPKKLHPRAHLWSNMVPLCYYCKEPTRGQKTKQFGAACPKR